MAVEPVDLHIRAHDDTRRAFDSVSQNLDRLQGQTRFIGRALKGFGAAYLSNFLADIALFAARTQEANANLGELTRSFLEGLPVLGRWAAVGYAIQDAMGTSDRAVDQASQRQRQAMTEWLQVVRKVGDEIDSLAAKAAKLAGESKVTKLQLAGAEPEAVEDLRAYIRVMADWNQAVEQHRRKRDELQEAGAKPEQLRQLAEARNTYLVALKAQYEDEKRLREQQRADNEVRRENENIERQVDLHRELALEKQRTGAVGDEAKRRNVMLAELDAQRRRANIAAKTLEEKELVEQIFEQRRQQMVGEFALADRQRAGREAKQAQGRRLAAREMAFAPERVGGGGRLQSEQQQANRHLNTLVTQQKKSVDWLGRIERLLRMLQPAATTTEILN